MGRKCCVPGCRSNYDNKPGYIPSFQFPTSTDLKSIWIQAINRVDFSPSSTAVVCVKHFEEQFIIREDRVTRDNGSVLVVNRKKLRLTSDAVPSIFPNQLNYLSKKYSPERKSLDKRRGEIEVPDKAMSETSTEVLPDVMCEVTHHASRPAYPEDKIITWNFSAPEPKIFKGFLSIRSMAAEKIKNDYAEQLKEYEDKAKSLRNIMDETKVYRDKIRNFLENKSYLFKTPLEELASHPSFQRDFINNTHGVSGKGFAPAIDGLEVLTEVSGTKANLPPRGELKRKPLKAGTQVWAMKTNFIERFVQGTVMTVRDAELYKVRIDDGKGTPPKLYNAKQLAYRELCNVVIPVGTRIIARYSDGMFAGVVAEVPITTNRERYLIFFDDGYAQYIGHEDIRVVCSQSNDVSNDMNLEVKLFVHEYLAKYPERAMLKLQVNQRIKTEYDFTWLDTKVLEVDCSMVQLLFLESGRKEWLYRGSTRLKLLYDELTNAQANRLAGKHRRHNVVPRKPHQPYVEYTRDIVTIDSDSDGENSSSQGRQQPNRSLLNGQIIRNKARKSTTLKPRLPGLPNSTNGKMQRDYKSHLGTKDFSNLELYERNKFKTHTCSILCREIQDPALYKGRKSPFTIPLYLGWERQVRKFRRSGTKVCVMYRAPCGRHVRTLQEIQDYLWTVSSKLTVDFFSLEPSVLPFRFFTPKEVLYKIDDVSDGKENVQISCVNTWNSDPPPHVEYAAKRFPGKGVDLNEDKEFLIGCSCTDYCQNSDTCECQQITNFAQSGKLGGNVGYKFRRLKEPVISGIYECNDRCKCGPHCGNRVVQNGLQVRLQMFKTQRKGWGIRCLDDLEAGMFICIYAGQLLTEQGADEEGRQLGDEYLAELDHIEVNERTKEGYESDVSDMDVDEGESKKEENNKSEEPSSNSTDSEAAGDSDSDFESCLRTTANTTYSTRSGKKSILKKSDSSSSLSFGMEDQGSSSNLESVKDLPDITTQLDSYTINTCPLSPASAALVEKTKLKRTPQISQNGPDSKSITKKSYSINFAPPIALPVKDTYKSIRSFYAENNSLFVMDAKTKGNIGRYLNHSCDPNLFVQSVFVNTHDLRFHEVAFFAHRFIVAGTELTWDYNYEVGSVPNKTMYCYCDSRYCRGRLL